jgi:TRAP-type mannitol/chloroaromatic compound transport system permease large subunit
MGILALPEMLKRGYDPRLATGTICASGTLGILIPPSVLTIVYSVTAQVSIGKMLIAGIVPGILLGLLYITYILVVGYFRPELIPAREQGRRASWGEKFSALKSLILPSLIIVMVLGSIFFGVATPTEAAAVGVLGAGIAAILRGSLSRAMLADCATGTLKTTGMILWITLGAKAYVAIFTSLGGADTLFRLLEGLNANPYVEIGIILLTVPVFLPVIQFYGFDHIWFGVLFALTIQMGYISPPFGYTLFYIKGTLPKGVSMATVYRGILPFFLLQVLGLLICVALPDLVTWLPERMR